jgi:type IV conjugative transfer system protein TraL
MSTTTKSTKREVPQYLHQPIKILWFDLDEIVLVNILLMLAMIFGNIFWLLLIVLPYVVSKSKKNKPKGFLRHYLYKIGVVDLKMVPPYFEKRFSE